MTLSEIVQTLVTVVVSGGVFGAIVNIWNNRHKPAVDRQAANDATRKSYAETYRSEIDTMKLIIAELREALERDNAAHDARLAGEEQARERLEAKIAALSQRVDEAERHARRYREKLDMAVAHISQLEDHINRRLPPPPPERPTL